jgi:hypothetical protein
MSEPNPQPNEFLAVSLMTDAKQYRQAARTLSESRFDGITSPHYFLIAHCIDPTVREGLDTLDRMDREISPAVARAIPRL